MADMRIFSNGVEILVDESNANTPLYYAKGSPNRWRAIYKAEQDARRIAEMLETDDPTC